MSDVTFPCPHCGQSITAPLDRVGTPVECPHCHHEVHVPPPADAPQDFAQLPPAEPPFARPPRKGSWTALLLVFLIPYALVTTGVIAWLLWKQARDQQHPLEWLIDQQPADGGPKLLPRNDLPLIDRQKTSLARPLQVGDVVELTPLSAELTPAGDQAILTLKMRNISKDLRFNPLPQSFLVQGGFTFLQFGGQRVYGGRLAWQRAASGVLDPGEERTVVLTTLPRDAGKIRQLTDYRGQVLWRLEVRRGLVQIQEKFVSATAVVGVEFDVAVLLHDQRGLARRVDPPASIHTTSLKSPIAHGRPLSIHQIEERWPSECPAAAEH
jgi:hypothetical protein